MRLYVTLIYLCHRKFFALFFVQYNDVHYCRMIEDFVEVRNKLLFSSIDRNKRCLIDDEFFWFDPIFFILEIEEILRLLVHHDTLQPYLSILVVC